MITSSAASVGPDGRLRELRSGPPLTLRRIGSDDPGECALCLVGTAAGPLPGDDLRLSLTVDPGARASLAATGASIVQGEGGEPAQVRFDAALGAGARLVADPGPLVACAGSRVDVRVALDLAADAAVEWHELVVLGRTHDDEAGSVSLRWDVTRAGLPVLRQRVVLPAGADHTFVSGRHRVLASALISGPSVRARTVVASPTCVAQKVAADTVLCTVLSDDAAQVRRELRHLMDDLGRSRSTAMLRP